MMTEYLLPCRCGQTHRVSQRQSGEMLECSCGTRLVVPTLRELGSLEPAPVSALPAAHAWGARQKLFFVGLLVTLGCLVACGYFRFVQMPAVPEFATTSAELDKLKPADAWQFWATVRHGMPQNAPANLAYILDRIDQVQRKIVIALGGAAAGLVVAGCGLLVGTKKSR
jgi:hypothetical protein